MSRNEEKAASMLNRWTTAQHRSGGGASGWGIRRTATVAGFQEQQNEQMQRKQQQKQAQLKAGRFDRQRIGRRPLDPNEVQGDPRVAEQWRMQVVREIGAAIVAVQDESLPEEALRELNARINRLMREQERWERRIVELGGRDHRAMTAAARASVSDTVMVSKRSLQQQSSLSSSSSSAANVSGAEFVTAPLADGGNVMYFGAARNLPEVRAVFERQKADKRRRQMGGAVSGDATTTTDAVESATLRQRRGMPAPQTVTGGDYTAEELRAAQAAAREPLDAAYFGLGTDDAAVRQAEAEVGALLLRKLIGAQQGRDVSRMDESDLRAAAGRTLTELVRGPGVPVPTLAEVERELVEHRKQALLARFGGVRPAEDRAASEAAMAQALDRKRKR